MEGDVDYPAAIKKAGKFQSTPSAWRETRITDSPEGVLIISIHSLRMEGDRVENMNVCIRNYFNPLPPHGGRLGQDF